MIAGHFFRRTTASVPRRRRSTTAQATPFRIDLGCRTIIGPLFALIAVSACSAPPPTTTLSFDGLGTLIDVTLWQQTSIETAQLIELERNLRDIATHWHATAHAWHTGPTTDASANLRAGEWFAPEPSVAELLTRALEIAAQSDGAFDPSIGEATATYGFHETPPNPRQPSESWLATWQKSPPSFAAIEQKNDDGANNGSGDIATKRRNTFRGHHPRLALDFGGIAKGAIGQAMVETLAAQGRPAALISLGGDLMLYGRPGDRDWRIALRAPIGPPLPPSTCSTQTRSAHKASSPTTKTDQSTSLIGHFVLPATSAAKPHALFTSGVYERGGWVKDSFGHCRWIHHLIDPARGAPTEGVRAATVWHDDPVLADAAASALIIAASRALRASSINACSEQGRTDQQQDTSPRSDDTHSSQSASNDATTSSKNDPVIELATRLGLTHWLVVYDDGRILATTLRSGGVGQESTEDWFVPHPTIADRIEWIVASHHDDQA
ncbi:MAG: FAD:protein FMN transferase [Thioalkalivibrionaceae bacterium]